MRPGIQKALAILEAGEANILITMKLDRTGRDVDVIRLVQKQVINAGAKLVFADGMNFENNAIGKLMMTQVAGFAEYEREMIRERCLSGKRKLAENGIQPTRSHSPFGYHIVRKADVLRGDYTPDMNAKMPSKQIGVGIAGYKERTRLGSLRLSVLPDANSDPCFVGAILSGQGS